MKKYIILLSMAVLAMCSCQKSAVENFSGSYSFKTGGSLELKTRVLDLEKGGLEFKDTLIKRSVVPEIGQMRIAAGDGDRVVVMMDIMAGDLIVMDAVVNGDNITLAPVSRKVLVYRETGLSFVENVPVTVSGTGRRMDGSVIFNLNYEGDFELGVFPCTVVASDVKCVANRNE